MGFTNNKTDKILEFKNQGIKAAAGTVSGEKTMSVLLENLQFLNCK